ncbi:UNVERIFIED_CONTAM: hypothetical protein FKN15_077354 [Acipenser sinensis]
MFLRVSAMPDVCLACLDKEGWCFLCGEVRHLPLSQNNAWQEREEPQHPVSVGEDPLAAGLTSPLSSEGIWDWLVEPERNVEEVLPDVVNLLWARDGKR